MFVNYWFWSQWCMKSRLILWRYSHGDWGFLELQKPGIGMKRALPAKDSETPLTRSGDALPRTRKRAGISTRSERGRSVSKSPGSRCISSITTSPLSGSSVTSGVERAALEGALSRSKKWTSDPVVSLKDRAAIWAKVVFPACRAPRRTVTGDSLRKTRISKDHSTSCDISMCTYLHCLRLSIFFESVVTIRKK